MYTAFCFFSKHVHNLSIFVHLAFRPYLMGSKKRERENALLFPGPVFWTES